ncbi:MAG: hypothetical protein ACT4PM_01550 [Gemmatimonadales bacterium]
MATRSAEATGPAPLAAETARPPAILHPVIDLLCTGGLSILVIVPLLMSGRTDLAFLSVPVIVWAQYVLNYSHFMASYRIIYRDRAMILRHQWASIGIPLILAGYGMLAFWQAGQGRSELVTFMVGVGSAYLAWHYTGQVWGMMASYTYLAGNRFEPRERFFLRGSLRILLAWHVIWFARTWIRETRMAEPFWIDPLYQAISAGAIAALVMGGLGMVMLWRRTGRLLPARAVVAWLAIFTWYAAIARWGVPGLLLLVQPAHALQYIEFPVRVELNRATARSAARVGIHMAGYAAVLLLVTLFVILLVPGPAMSVVSNVLGVKPNQTAPLLLLMFINIHHYFTDGVAWKLSNPEVRRELFAHVKPVPAPTKVASPIRTKTR